MTLPTPEDSEFFRIENIAYDVGLAFGSTTDQAQARIRRCIYRAALSIAGTETRRWSWLKCKDSFLTTTGENEYSIRQDVKVLHHLWMEGVSRQRIDRIPTTQFVERVPDSNLMTGIPRLFDEQGVDSSGAKIVSLYPVPSGELEVFYRFTRKIVPFSDPSQDIRVLWGMPEQLLEALTQKATALAAQGISATKFAELTTFAEQLIDGAYADDQNNTATTYRSPMIHGRDALEDGPMLPPQFGRD